LIPEVFKIRHSAKPQPLGNINMRRILTITLLLTTILSFGQMKNTYYEFSDSVQFFWPNNNLQYKYLNIYTYDSILNTSTIFIEEQFFSPKNGKVIKVKKFKRKYGMQKINELREKSHKYLNDKNEELKAEKATSLKKRFEEDTLHNYSTLEILKELCMNSENGDTIKVKHGLLLGLGKAYFYTMITKKNNDFYIQNFTEELHIESFSKDSSFVVQNLILDSECLVTLNNLINEIDNEKEKCWRMESKRDYRWTFYFDSGELKDEEISDFFGYQLYFFLDGIICN